MLKGCIKLVFGLLFLSSGLYGMDQTEEYRKKVMAAQEAAQELYEETALLNANNEPYVIKYARGKGRVVLKSFLELGKDLSAAEYAFVLKRAEEEMLYQRARARASHQPYYVKYQYGIPHLVLYSSREAKEDDDLFGGASLAPDTDSDEDDNDQTVQQKANERMQKITELAQSEPVLLPDTHEALYGPRLPISYESAPCLYNKNILEQSETSHEAMIEKTDGVPS